MFSGTFRGDFRNFSFDFSFRFSFWNLKRFGGATEVQCEFIGPISGLNFGRLISGGEFLEGEFPGGGLFCWKNRIKNSIQEFGCPKFGRSKFVSQNSAPNSGSGGPTSPVRKYLPDLLGLFSPLISGNLFFKWGSPKTLHLKAGHLKMAFFSARCHLDSAFSVKAVLGTFPAELP